MRASTSIEMGCCEILEHYGSEGQVTKAIEELSELIKELAKDKGTGIRRDKVVEEMADVYIMLKQLQYIYDATHSDLDVWMDMKIHRTLGEIAREVK